MRTLIHLLFLLAAMTSYGAPAPKTLLSVEVKGRYEIQKTEILFEKAEWICKTKHIPFYVSDKKPFEEATLSAVQRSSVAKKSLGACRDKVTVVDKTQAKVRQYYGCADDLNFKTLISEIAKSCGQN